MDKPVYNVVSFSGGKDSTAMLLGMIERDMPIDCILFCDTGLEFPDMYDHIDKVEKYIGRPITRIKAEYSYEYMMFDIPVRRDSNSPILQRYGADAHGYGWPGPRQRWCTTRLKDIPREKFLRDLRQQYTIREHIGIAADEGYRLERKRNKDSNHIHPLVDWGMTEAECLQYCCQHGFNWNGLYEHFSRVSCWCCPLQSLPELRKLHKYYPELWKILKDWDKRTWRNFRADFGVKELEVRFALEESYLKDGKSIQSREFFTELRKTLEDRSNGQ